MKRTISGQVLVSGAGTGVPGVLVTAYDVGDLEASQDSARVDDIAKAIEERGRRLGSAITDRTGHFALAHEAPPSREESTRGAINVGIIITEPESPDRPPRPLFASRSIRRNSAPEERFLIQLAPQVVLSPSRDLLRLDSLAPLKAQIAGAISAAARTCATSSTERPKLGKKDDQANETRKKKWSEHYRARVTTTTSADDSSVPAKDRRVQRRPGAFRFVLPVRVVADDETGSGELRYDADEKSMVYIANDKKHRLAFGGLREPSRTAGQLNAGTQPATAAMVPAIAVDLNTSTFCLIVSYSPDVLRADSPKRSRLADWFEHRNAHAIKSLLPPQ
ncbi:MAG: hypothetical protein FLDDKLPJ_01656 [Phycisphaerae bacterium]|nr:hypothetical protein [Phycisphaerae bacterium]